MTKKEIKKELKLTKEIIIEDLKEGYTKTIKKIDNTKWIIEYPPSFLDYEVIHINDLIEMLSHTLKYDYLQVELIQEV